jgi:two-component sensor histidine kinase
MTVTTVANPRGRPGYEATLPCSPQSARSARNLVLIVLSVWGLDDLADDTALVVAELVANAARHTTGTRLRVSITRPSGSVVRVAVTDRSSELPVLLHPGAQDEDGRGLALVTALAEAWGATPLRRGKRVWAELRSAGSA